jgi:hypothetical protein
MNSFKPMARGRILQEIGGNCPLLLMDLLRFWAKRPPTKVSLLTASREEEAIVQPEVEWMS